MKILPIHLRILNHTVSETSLWTEIVAKLANCKSLDQLLQNINHNLPRGLRWETLLQGERSARRFTKHNREVEDSEYLADILAAVKSIGIDDTWLDEKRMRSNNWEVIRLVDFQIYCIARSLGYTHECLIKLPPPFHGKEGV